MAALGKILQLAGLTVPILAVISELAGTIELKQMLMFLVASVAAFWLGRLLEGYTRRE